MDLYKLDQAIGAILLILALIFLMLALSACTSTAPDATEGHEPYSGDFRWVYETDEL